MDTPKRKKPEWEKHKTVYFNTQHPEDAELFDYIQRVASRNFSAYMKRLAYEDMCRKEQIARSPFDGSPLTSETVPVTIKPVELPTTQPKAKPAAEEKSQEKVIEKEEEIPVKPEPKVEEPIIKEEQQEESAGFDFLDNAANLFRRRE